MYWKVSGEDGSHTFPSNTGARGAPLSGVPSRTGALLSALGRWRLERWRSMAFFQPRRCCPRLSFWLGSWSPLRFYLHSRGVPRRLLSYVLALFSRSFDRWYLTHWCSFAELSVDSSAGGTSCTSAPPEDADRVKYPSSLASSRGVPVQSGSPSHPGQPPSAAVLVALSSHSFGRWHLIHWRSP